MMYIIIVIFFILSYISNKFIYKLDESIDKSLSNKILIFLPNILIPILIYNKYGLDIRSVSYMLIIPFLTIVSIIDFRTIFVYDGVIVSGIMIQSVIFLLSEGLSSNLMEHIEGLVIGIVLSYILVKVTKSIGYGDIGFYGLCSFVLGKEYVFSMIILSFLLATICGLYIIAKMKKSKTTPIPFTPFISLATVLIILTQNDIISLYFNFLSKSL